MTYHIGITATRLVLTGPQVKSVIELLRYYVMTKDDLDVSRLCLHQGCCVGGDEQVTIAAATLGYASVPVPPLNAAIALSILFLCPEIVRSWRGQTSLTIRHPWLVAFAFGLLHGFGFASGLTELGLPRSEIPLALLLFNVGVELGQIGFVVLIFALDKSFHILEIIWPRWAELV